jgi:hypothetical protein
MKPISKDNYRKGIVTKCERCDKAVSCKNLRPCKDFAPSLNSIFLAEVERISNEIPDLERMHDYN